MKKLTAISIMCRSKIIQTFVYLPVYNGKTVLTQKAIDDLFQDFWGFTPEKGETISFL